MYNAGTEKKNFITSFIRKIRLYHMDMLTAIIKFAWRDKKACFLGLETVQEIRF